MKLLTAAQSRALDRAATDANIPGASLMSSAARHIADAAAELLPKGGFAAVFCGTGGNGGDGFGAAAELLRRGYTVRVFTLGDPDKMGSDAREMLRRFRDYGGAPEDFAQTPDAESYAAACGVIIDAILGAGRTRAVTGEFLRAIECVNASRAKVVAADIPSGADADNGAIHGVAARADVTVTFTAAKPGHFLTPASLSCGEVRVRGIGIPRELSDRALADAMTHAVTRGDVVIPRRAPDTHKGDYGRVLAVAGSVGYTGAPVFAALAASRAGAGLVALGVPERVYPIAAVKCVGEMPFPLAGADTVSIDAWDRIAERLAWADAALLGPGLQNTPDTREIVLRALKTAAIPLILDADGINALSGNIDILRETAAPVLLTPHDGEFTRVGGDFTHGRLHAARAFAAKYGCVLILKGHRTITALPDGSAYINTTGCAAMAKGGSGDVLAGMLLAFLGQGFPIKDAAIAAVYLHGLAGELAARELGEYSVTPEDLLRHISGAILSCAEPPT
ncbi:MAG: NAD(P)H-hydrate dehydratase [Oscillospiraceae bacterium]|nr:NAD(P)H-hydrate dehydratase [Oscillospiraceae bacterium]